MTPLTTIASRVGRPPKFKTPLELAKVADDYFAWCDANPITTNTRKSVAAHQAAKAGSSASSDEVEFKVPRPYTKKGFADFAGIANWRDFRTYHVDDDFSTIIHAIEQRIENQMEEGAMAGVFNANLVARLNGIAEKTESKTETKQEITVKDELSSLTDDQKQRLADLLDDIEHEKYMKEHYGEGYETDSTE